MWVSRFSKAVPSEAGAQNVTPHFDLAGEAADEVGAGAFDRHDTGDRLAVPGDQQALSIQVIQKG